MRKKQAFNPYLPSYEYIPDGEPRVFGDRIYLYGSHDRFGSAGFCLNDYVCYSADVNDLTEWRYEGVIYPKTADPRNQNIPEDAPEQTLLFGIEPEKEEDLNPRGIHAQWAPDVVQGPDGRYYLYYCLDFLPEIGVAVCDTPAVMNILDWCNMQMEHLWAGERVICSSSIQVLTWKERKSICSLEMPR